MSNPFNIRNATPEMTDLFQRRHLDSHCPVATRYFTSGLRVLDVGCGPGSMTIDIARLVRPGSVVGVDVEQAPLAKAASLAGAERVANVSFQLGDVYKLPFDDSVFDTAFCINLIEYLRDPVAALQELSRVIKEDGKVIVVRPQDFASVVFYPPVPTFHQVWSDVERNLEKLTDVVYYSPNAGSRLYEYYSRARMRDIQITGFVAPENCVHAGTTQFEATYNRWKAYYTRPRSMGESPLVTRMRELGVWSGSLSSRLLEELEAWHNHPYAFQIGAGVCAAAGPCP